VIAASSASGGREDTRNFREWLQFDEVYVPYTEVDHPDLGTVLVGGTKKWASRIAPPWAQEEECHRNFAFTMYHADQMPRLEWGVIETTNLGGNLRRITVEVRNDRLIPTITAIARDQRIGLPDFVSAGSDDEGVRIVAGGPIESLLPTARMEAVEHRPDRIANPRGVPGLDSVLHRFIVEAPDGATLRLEYASEKGGTLRREIVIGTDDGEAEDESADESSAEG